MAGAPRPTAITGTPGLTLTRTQSEERLALLKNEQKQVLINIVEHVAMQFEHPSYPEYTDAEKAALRNLYMITSAT